MLKQTHSVDFYFFVVAHSLDVFVVHFFSLRFELRFDFVCFCVFGRAFIEMLYFNYSHKLFVLMFSVSLMVIIYNLFCVCVCVFFSLFRSVQLCVMWPNV